MTLTDHRLPQQDEPNEKPHGLHVTQGLRSILEANLLWHRLVKSSNLCWKLIIDTQPILRIRTRTLTDNLLKETSSKRKCVWVLRLYALIAQRCPCYTANNGKDSGPVKSDIHLVQFLINMYIVHVSFAHYHSFTTTKYGTTIMFCYCQLSMLLWRHKGLMTSH